MVFKIFSFTLRILRNSNISNKLILLIDVLLIFLKIFFFSRFKNQPFYFRFLGFHIHTPSIETFLFLIEEIFIDTIYSIPLASKDPHIIDCGGNIGLSVLYFKILWPNCQIQVFEPDPDNYIFLEKNILENHLTNISLFQKALGPRKESLTLFKKQNSPLITTTRQRKSDFHSIKVSSEPLSAFLTKPIDLLKMDIEGSEWDVLQELVTSHKISFIRNIILELHHQFDQNLKTSDFLKILESYSFSYHLKSMSLNSNLLDSSQEIIIYAHQNKIS